MLNRVIGYMTEFESHVCLVAYEAHQPISAS